MQTFMPKQKPAPKRPVKDVVMTLRVTRDVRRKAEDKALQERRRLADWLSIIVEDAVNAA
jgi:hypothetical protein